MLHSSFNIKIRSTFNKRGGENSLHMMENTVNGMQATEVGSHTADFSMKSANAWDDGNAAT